MKSIGNYLWRRVKEPSTWVGAAALLGLLDVNLHGPTKWVVFYAALVCAAISIVLRDPGHI